MTAPVPMAQVWRGDMVECTHLGHAAIVDETGALVAAWGDPKAEIYPRSSCKMLQALPLIESGAADAYHLTPEHLALACASHNAADIHTSRVTTWLASLDLTDADLRCGAQVPNDKEARFALIRAVQKPCQYHNNCSGKHSGFLTLSRHLGAGPEYNDIDHPVQVAIKSAFEDMTGAASQRFAIDGCSAPNHTTTVEGLARAMAQMASDRSGSRGAAAGRLVEAMRAFPELVAGEGRACTALMRDMSDGVVKTGAEGVFTAILPALKMGVALKITDGATRASEAAITALLVQLGVLDVGSPAASLMNKDIRNWRGTKTGAIRADKSLRVKA